MTTEDDKDFKAFSKCWICFNVYVNCDVKVRDPCHFFRKYRSSVHTNCNIKIKSYH